MQEYCRRDFSGNGRDRKRALRRYELSSRFTRRECGRTARRGPPTPLRVADEVGLAVARVKAKEKSAYAASRLRRDSLRLNRERRLAERVGFEPSSTSTTLEHSQMRLNRNNRIHENRRYWNKTGTQLLDLLLVSEHARREFGSLSSPQSNVPPS